MDAKEKNLTHSIRTVVTFDNGDPPQDLPSIPVDPTLPMFECRWHMSAEAAEATNLCHILRAYTAGGERAVRATGVTATVRLVRNEGEVVEREASNKSVPLFDKHGILGVLDRIEAMEKSVYMMSRGARALHNMFESVADASLKVLREQKKHGAGNGQLEA